MKKSELDKYVGKLVTISFQDGDVLGGTLEQGMGLGNKLYNDDKSYYHLEEHHLTFRAYQVKKIKNQDALLYCIARLTRTKLEIIYSSFDKKDRDDILNQMYNSWHADYSNVEALNIRVGFNNTEFNKGV